MGSLQKLNNRINGMLPQIESEDEDEEQIEQDEEQIEQDGDHLEEIIVAEPAGDLLEEIIVAEPAGDLLEEIIVAEQDEEQIGQVDNHLEEINVAEPTDEQKAPCAPFDSRIDYYQCCGAYSASSMLINYAHMKFGLVDFELSSDLCVSRELSHYFNYMDYLFVNSSILQNESTSYRNTVSNIRWFISLFDVGMGKLNRAYVFVCLCSYLFKNMLFINNRVEIRQMLIRKLDDFIEHEEDTFVKINKYEQLLVWRNNLNN